MIKTILIIITSVTLFGVIFFIIVRNLLRRKLDQIIEDAVNEDQIKKAVRDAVASLPQSKLDQIINEELTKIIQERLNSSKIIISTENKKN